MTYEKQICLIEKLIGELKENNQVKPQNIEEFQVIFNALSTFQAMLESEINRAEVMKRFTEKR